MTADRAAGALPEEARAMEDYEITTAEVAEQPIISIRGRLDQEEIPAFLGSAFQEMFLHLGRVGVSAADASPGV